MKFDCYSNSQAEARRVYRYRVRSVQQYRPHHRKQQEPRRPHIDTRRALVTLKAPGKVTSDKNTFVQPPPRPHFNHWSPKSRSA